MKRFVRKPEDMRPPNGVNPDFDALPPAHQREVLHRDYMNARHLERAEREQYDLERKARQDELDDYGEAQEYLCMQQEREFAEEERLKKKGKNP